MTALTAWPDITRFGISTDYYTEPFWNAARESRLTVPRCEACGRFRMPPTPFCPACRSQRIDWVTLSGKGKVYSYTIVKSLVDREANIFEITAPALIEPLEAPSIRLISVIVDADPAHIAVDVPVQVTWQRREDGLTIPRFLLDLPQG